DVALDWGGDQAYARKRQHTADDLINLVDAVAAACEDDRLVIAAPPSTLPAQVEQLVKRAAGGPLICVHPAAGNAMKQWPADYFAVVVDRLIETHGARIALIGAPGEEPIANELLARLRRPEAVTSLVGALPLADLPARLAVSRQRQRAEAHRRRTRRPDGRGPFRYRRCPRMGSDRRQCRRSGARDGVLALLSDKPPGLPPRPRLPARIVAGDGLSSLR